MNYAKIQETLEADKMFGPLVAVKDVKVNTRNGEVFFSALTIQIAEAIEKRGMLDRAGHRPTILAFAGILTKGKPIPPGAAPVVKKPDVPETIVVKSAPAPEPKPAAPPVQRVRDSELAKFVDKGDILKFQSTIAIGQLLAAVYQLAENDYWEGYEQRRKLLNDLLDSYEAVSKKYVNFSVKQILRAKAEEQFRNGQ